MIPVNEDIQDKIYKMNEEYSKNCAEKHNYIKMLKNMKITDFPGGLFAVCVTPAKSDQMILSSWNRLLAEWLPKSAFIKGKQCYMEEFFTYGDKIVRMKLYLPIERKEEPDMIRFINVD